MTEAVLSQLKQSPPEGVHTVDSGLALAVIHDQGCAAAIWRRAPLPSFQDWINRLSPETLPKARVVLHADRVPAVVQAICDQAGTPAGPERSRLMDDISALAEIFSEVMQAKYLRFRLDVVTTNACRKFHVDAVTARLVCTYRGTGTQYGTVQPNGDPDRVFTVPTGAPIVLRGTLWPELPSSGLLHRSPPIEGSGETRLLLVLDAVDDPGNAV